MYSGHENVIVLGDFNLEPGDNALSSIIHGQDLYNMINKPTCFKSSNGRCIYLLVTNRKHSFMHSKSFETGFNDHHHMIYTILRTTITKLPPEKIIYRDYKTYSQQGCLRWGAGGAATPSALIHEGQEGRELFFILNSFHLSYLLKRHFPAL